MKVHFRRLPSLLALMITSSAALLLPGASVWGEHDRSEWQSLLDERAPSYVRQDSLSGRLTIGGSDTMKPMLVKLAAQFRFLHPQVRIAIEDGGSSTAIRQFIVGYSSQRRGEKSRMGHDADGQTRILASSRQITEKEMSNFVSRYGYEPLVLPIAMDAVAIYVHPDNPLPGLTLPQLEAIYTGLPFGTPLSRWGQLGLEDGWENQPIHLYGRSRGSGTHDFFESVALNGNRMKADITMLTGSATEVLAIANDRNGIGFAGIGYNSRLVRVVPIAPQSQAAFVVPSAQSVHDGSYPLARFLYLYVNQPPTRRMEGPLAAFLKFATSRDGQRVIANAGVYPLPPEVLAKNLELIYGQGEHIGTQASVR